MNKTTFAPISLVEAINNFPPNHKRLSTGTGAIKVVIADTGGETC